MSKAGAVAGCLLVLVVALTTAVGCSSDATTTTAATDSVQTSTTDGSSPPTTGSLMTEWDKLLRNNAKIQHQFAIYLSEIDAANDDPLLGLYYGIQARTNALTCRKALPKRRSRRPTPPCWRSTTPSIEAAVWPRAL